MSEESKNKAVELSDEEMDKVAGGTASIISQAGNNTLNIQFCNGSANAAAFQNALKNGMGCSHYVKGRYDATTPSCRSCTLYNGHPEYLYERGGADETVEYYRNQGYDVLLL